MHHAQPVLQEVSRTDTMDLLIDAINVYSYPVPHSSIFVLLNYSQADWSISNFPLAEKYRSSVRRVSPLRTLRLGFLDDYVLKR